MPIDPVKTLLCAAPALLAAPLARAADYGEVKHLATVPTPPGAPEGLAIDQNVAYVAGPARLGTFASGQPSRVLGFDATTGQLLHDWPTQGEDLLREHANSCVALDAAGRLHVLNSQLGLYRLDPATGVQTPYGAPFPDLPSCGLLVQAPCSPTLVDLPALPNDLVFTASGDAYVTDSFQATIWRVPAGGGAPQPVDPTPAPNGEAHDTLEAWHLFADARAQTPAPAAPVDPKDLEDPEPEAAEAAEAPVVDAPAEAEAPMAGVARVDSATPPAQTP
mgnify:CR=1 FL=1